MSEAMDSAIEIKRPIHYLGSKLRMLDVITDCLDKLDPSRGPVCDLFSGSGTVTKSLSLERAVYSCDIQHYSETLCNAIVLGAEDSCDVGAFVRDAQTLQAHYPGLQAVAQLLSYERHCMDMAEKGSVENLYEIIESGSIFVASSGGGRINENGKLKQLLDEVQKAVGDSEQRQLDTLVLRYFGGLYFSYSQSVVLDCLLAKAHSLIGVNKDKAIAAVLSTASEIVNTVGNQFAQPLKVRDSKGLLKIKLCSSILSARSQDPYPVFEKWLSYYLGIIPSEKPYRFLRMDYRDALETLRGSAVSAVYADPPYTRYHYSRYYHVLETMCLRDLPEVSKTCRDGGKLLSRAVYRADRHQSPFCIKSKAEGAFESLFRGVSLLDAPLILSYSPFTPSQAVTPRLQTIDQLVTKASEYFSDVQVVSPGAFTHSKFNSSEKNFETNHEAELLILCR